MIKSQMNNCHIRLNHALAAEPDINVLFEAFPHLTREDVQACLAFAQEVIAEEEVFPLADENMLQHHAHV
jgi:hypothetical protein